MWRKKLSYEKMWADFKKFFAEDYHGLHKMQLLNANRAGFHGDNMTITVQYKIIESVDNLAMATTSEKLHTQLTSTIKQMAENNIFNGENQDPNGIKLSVLHQTVDFSKNKTDKQLQEMTMNKSWIQQDIAESTDINFRGDKPA